MKRILFLLTMSASLFACKDKNYKLYTNDPLLYCKTVKKLNDVVLYNNFTPVVASRNYAYANIAAYECMAAGDSNYLSLSGQIKHLPPMPKPPANKVIDYQLASMLSFIKVGNAVTFPEGVLMDSWNQLKKGASDAGMPADVLNNTVDYSNSVVDAIMKWSKGDHYAETRSAEKYTVTDQEGRWIPTPPAYAQALEPHWCDIRTLVLDSCSQFSPPPPPRYNMKDKNSPYCMEVMKVKEAGDKLSAEQKAIANFFDDNPFNLHVTGHVMYATKKFSPPGHWMNVVGIASKKSKTNFDETVAAYTETAIALFDGFITCWKAKYTFNTIRPETVINKYIDPAWQPYIQTPPFPSYVSAHSVVSTATAEVMSHYFGDHFEYTDSSELEFGIPNRSFKSFRDEAAEAAISRLYGGIHFPSDIEKGTDLGQVIGKYIVQKLHLRRTDNNLAYLK